MTTVELLGISHWHAGMHLDAALAAGAGIRLVWDEDPELARAFAARHGLVAATSFDEVRDAKADICVLMGRPGQVGARARTLIEDGRFLVIEKPAASTTRELEALRDQAAQKGIRVGVPFPNRYGPVFAGLRELQGAGRAGPLAQGHFRLVNGPPQRYRDDGVPWLLDPRIGGGGALRNLGIHGIDAALGLASGPLRIEYARISTRMHQAPVEDHALVVLTDDAGALFTIEAGYTFASMAPGGDFEWRLVTGNATLIDRGDTAFVATLDDGRRRPLAPEPTATRYRLFMADTIDRLRRGLPPAVTLDDYCAAMALIDEAYQKAEQ